MKHRSQWLAGLAAVALALITSATAFGYSGPGHGAVTVAGPGGTLICGDNITVTATVVDAAGKLIAGQPVAWAFTSTPSTADKINTTTTTTTTNASGVAMTTVVLVCVAGNRTITATAGGVSAGAVLGVTAAGLPNTSTLPGETPAQNLPVIGTLLAVLAMAAGGVLALRRISFSRR